MNHKTTMTRIFITNLGRRQLIHDFIYTWILSPIYGELSYKGLGCLLFEQPPPKDPFVSAGH